MSVSILDADTAVVAVVVVIEDGKDFVDGGDGLDGVMIIGSSEDEVFLKETVEAYNARKGVDAETLNPATEFVISRGLAGSETDQVIIEITDVETVELLSF